MDAPATDESAVAWGVWFVVLDGEVTFFAGDQRHDLVPGQVGYGHFHLDIERPSARRSLSFPFQRRSRAISGGSIN
jgi:hypothetical protein